MTKRIKDMPIRSKDGVPVRQPRIIDSSRVDSRRPATNYPQEVNLSPLPVSRDLAVELMLHHLSLARMYFEATPDDGGRQVEQEARRIFASDDADMTGALAFNAALVAYYENLKRGLGE